MSIQEPVMSQFLNKKDYEEAKKKFDESSKRLAKKYLEGERNQIEKRARPDSPHGKETQLQILAVMAQHGTEQQKKEVAQFLGFEPVEGQEQWEDLKDNGKEDYTIPISAKRIIALHNALVAGDISEAYNQLFWSLYYDNLDAAYTAFEEIRAKVV